MEKDGFSLHDSSKINPLNFAIQKPGTGNFWKMQYERIKCFSVDGITNQNKFADSILIPVISTSYQAFRIKAAHFRSYVFTRCLRKSINIRPEIPTVFRKQIQTVTFSDQ